MPLLPGISDSQEKIDEMIRVSIESGARYCFPASITLFGEGAHDSKTLVLRAVGKYYPELLDLYHELFEFGYQVPYQYKKEVEGRINSALQRFPIPRTIKQK